MTRSKLLTAATLALLFLAACGSTGMGDILGGGTGSRNDYEIRGTVDYVDTSSRVLHLTNVSGYNNMLSGGSNSVRVYFDDNTTVSYQGQTYRVADLERGDEVAVQVDESGNQLHAEAVTVTRDVSGSGSSSTYPSGNYSTLRGTVRYVDTARRTIELESASWMSRFDSGANTGNRVIVSYGSNTNVDVSGTLHPVSGLERGDVIEVQVQNANATTPFAERIVLVRDARY